MLLLWSACGELERQCQGSPTKKSRFCFQVPLHNASPIHHHSGEWSDEKQSGREQCLHRFSKRPGNGTAGESRTDCARKLGLDCSALDLVHVKLELASFKLTAGNYMQIMRQMQGSHQAVGSFAPFPMQTRYLLRL